ncbi:recombinase family protein [Photorhabdus luminescens]|uniref:recombinase family protein n=1 Tax=Photorhabdus luminescens TaxID=29488 RepID=UPI0020CD2A94|nr:recombinase family protein [Photorhabdus luminescens]
MRFREYYKNLYNLYRLSYAYIRISSVEQNSARQEIAIQNVGYEIKNTFTDVASGKDTHRPNLQQLLALLESGDTLVVHSIDRLCRNMMDMCNLTLQLKQRGVSLIFIKENIHLLPRVIRYKSYNYI